MDSRPGCFIVIEGTDGSGKGTQFKLLVESLEKEGYDVAGFDFPQYDQPSSYFVRRYLNGAYGSAEQVGPYTGSLFYALDRYEASQEIKAALAAGKVVLANRVTGSNMAHQGTKFNSTEERNGYFVWLDAIEFQMMDIPRPDLSIVLRVPADIAQGLVDQKEARSYTDKKRDLHEADLSHLEKSVQVYDSLCKTFPKDFKALDCVREGKLLDVTTIQKLIRETVDPLLPVRKKRTDAPVDPEYHIPEGLDEETTLQYTSLMNRIMSTHHDMHTHLQQYSSEHPELSIDSTEILRAVLPLAASEEVLMGRAAAPLDAELSNAFSHDMTPVTLTSVSTRNELSILPEVLYSSSGLSMAEIEAAVDTWSYDKKASALHHAIASPHARDALTTIRYEWDILQDYQSIVTTAQTLGADVAPQLLTPRYGYEVPQLLIDANISNAYELCFDTSLKLYSILQAAGHEEAAQLTMLHGHKIRTRLTCTAYDLYKTTTVAPALLTELRMKASEIHPLIASAVGQRGQQAD